MPSIVSLRAREILDSRGHPTLEAEVFLDCGTRARASVPSGASKGAFEAVELRDGDERRYGGLGVSHSISLVEGEIASLLCGFDASEQCRIDAALCALDIEGGKAAQSKGRQDVADRKDKKEGKNKSKSKDEDLRPKSHLGSQACLAVSWATARAAARSAGIPLYRHLGGVKAKVLPVPLLNILNGGAHASNGLDVQEFMVVPHGARDFAEGLRMGVEVYASLKSCLSRDGHSTALGDEGGFAPALRSTHEALDLLMSAISSTGLRSGTDISLALDCAASEYYEPGQGSSRREISLGGYRIDGELRDLASMVAYLTSLIRDYPIVSLEDPLAQEDWSGWAKLTNSLGNSVQLVGDDLFATNTSRLRRGIAENSCTALLLKPNQIGTLSESMSCGEEALRAGLGCIVSHRSGETEDSAIADLSVALNCGQIKTGAPARSERVSKYNRLLRIAEELGEEGIYGGAATFARLSRVSG